MTTSTTALTDVPTIQKPEHKVAAHIRDAAQATGVSFEYLLAQANSESRLNPEAKNRKSSAMGLFQFTAGTWMDMVKAHGAEYGLEKYADAIVKGSDGRWTVKDKELKKEILDLRRDPRMSALMAAEYAKDNEQVLESKLGRQVSTQDLYLAHFLGAGGALKVLKGRHQPESDQQPAELAGAARANPDVFLDPASGEQRSLDSVYATVEKRFRHAMNEANRVAGHLRPQVDLAALRPAERPAEDGTAATTTVAAASTQQPAAAIIEQAAKQGAALSMADIPADVTTFPTRLPPRPQRAEPAVPAAERGQAFPVPLPPPVTGARTAASGYGTLLSVNEEKG
ncbi:MAG: transglycosylase SLT domain-containing protein [Bacteroidales bacterium]